MFKIFSSIVVIVGLTGCGAADIFISGGGEIHWPRKGEPRRERVPQHRVPPREPVRYASELPHIPNGHLPPPGACKIWIPGKPPGHQGPPETCEKAFYYVRPGDMVVRRDDYDPNLIEVHTAFVRNNYLYFDVASYFVK